MLRLLALVSCGTRTVIDAVFSPLSSGETTCAPRLLASLHAGMILLADRNFGAGFLAAQIAGTRADFLIRVRTGNSSPKLPVLQRLPDGSWLSRFGGIPVRVIDAQVTITHGAGQAVSGCRLVTTLADPARYPARDLVSLYRERWEIEIGHRWCASSWFAFSWLCSLGVVGLLLGRVPAGSGVVAGRSCPALAQIADLLIVGGDDPAAASGGAGGGEPAAVDPGVDGGDRHAELGCQAGD